jgi:hypothetical protein
MEMFFSLAILALAGTVCIQIFFLAYTSRRQAREWNHIQEITTSVGEILEGTLADADSILTLLPGGEKDGETLFYSYDREWNICSSDQSFYSLKLIFAHEKQKKQASLTFTDRQGQELYQTDISFPILLTKGEGAS